jgi:hypothetical protein
VRGSGMRKTWYSEGEQGESKSKRGRVQKKKGSRESELWSAKVNQYTYQWTYKRMNKE